jgi:hypothetical protein
MEEHSPLGASGSNCWLNCAGSYWAQKDIPDKSSVFAYEGTCCHELAEICLANKIAARRRIGLPLHINKDFIVTSEMADYAQTYIDYVRSVGGVQEYEQKVSYSDWVPDGFGTADVIATVDDTLYVIDLKYGKGVKVFAEHNPQGMLYALGALNERAVFQDFKKVVIVIHQPRLEHLSEWSITPKTLYTWAEWVKERAALCLEPDAPRTPGEKQCQWCRAKATCPALAKQTEDSLLVHFEDMTTKEPPAPGNLTDQQLQTVLEHKTMIEKWLKAVEQHVVGRFESGFNFPGWKMVEGRSNRKWADEDKAEKLLRKLLGAEDAYKKKLLTAPAAEKALGKEDKYRIKDLIVKPEGKPTLVPEEDKRPALVGITADDFD